MLNLGTRDAAILVSHQSEGPVQSTDVLCRTQGRRRQRLSSEAVPRICCTICRNYSSHPQYVCTLTARRCALCMCLLRLSSCIRHRPCHQAIHPSRCPQSNTVNRRSNEERLDGELIQVTAHHTTSSVTPYSQTSTSAALDYVDHLDACYWRWHSPRTHSSRRKRASRSVDLDDRNSYPCCFPNRQEARR